ncbi:MAG: lipoprotein, partial [Calditrichaeota bacterium]|nr:lipoprotein [Calditrichota bacterium]
MIMRRVIFLLSALLLMSGCSLQKIALKTTSGLFSYGMDALYAEP